MSAKVNMPKETGTPPKVLFGYLSAEYRGGIKFQLDFTRYFEQIQVGFITSETKISYRDAVLPIGPIHLLPPTRHFFQRMAAMRRLAKEYDILYLNKTTLNPLEFIIVKAAHFKRVVYHSHSTTKDCKNPFMRAGWYVMHYLSRPFIGLVADKLYACSPEAARWLFGRRARETEVIHNGIEVERYRFDPIIRAQKRTEWGIQGFCIIHVGAFSAVKNQGYLVDAFQVFRKTCPDSRLLLVGDGPLLENVRQRVSDLGLEDSVIFLGQRTDVEALLQAADVFVLPSLGEGLPFSAIEAQAAGLPCIITQNASSLVRITQACSLFDVTRPAKDLAGEIERKTHWVRQDASDAISAAGFNVKKCARELESELKGLLNSR